MFQDSKEFDLFKIKHNNIEPAKGKILISMPFLQDTSFRKSVIILTEHDTVGTFGFVLNKTADYRLNDVLDGIPTIDIDVGYGGPVENDTLHFIHTLGEAVPDTIRVDRYLSWGGNIDTIKELLANGIATSKNIRFFIGYSGWAPNQLNDEIQSDTWLVSKLSADDYMSGISRDSLWPYALKQLGKKYSYWTTFPDNPNLN